MTLRILAKVLMHVVLRRNVPVNNFFSHGFNQYCRELMCLAEGHKTVPLVGIEPRTSRFRVRRSQKCTYGLDAYLLNVQSITAVSFDKNFSLRMIKPTFCICKTKGEDQLCSNCRAYQCLCFHDNDRTNPFRLKYKISSL